MVPGIGRACTNRTRRQLRTDCETTRIFSAHFRLQRWPNANGQQPRSLAGAFLTPVEDNGKHGPDSIAALESFRTRMDRAYGTCADGSATMDCIAGKGTLAELVAFATK